MCFRGERDRQRVDKRGLAIEIADAAHRHGGVEQRLLLGIEMKRGRLGFQKLLVDAQSRLEAFDGIFLRMPKPNINDRSWIYSQPPRAI